MFKDNALLAQLKTNIQESLPKVQGRVKATDKSYGFLETDEGKSYFIAPPQMKKVMHGDVILATLSSDKGKEQAQPVNLITSVLECFIARVNLNKNKLTLTPSFPYKGSAITAVLQDELYIDHGDYVIARLSSHPLDEHSQGKLSAEITSLVAASDDPFLPWLVTLAKHNMKGANVAIDAPEEQANWPMLNPEQPRQDDNQALFFTIDNSSTQDMDDAISIGTRDDGGWDLKVAVADPSAYIAAGDQTDMAAQARGYTHYLPHRTTTMLPESLSHDICSLKENEIRPALVCSMVINARGQLQQGAVFTLAWITSKAKLNYQQVTDFIDGKQDEVIDSITGLAAALSTLNQMAFARSFWRANNTQLFDNQADYRFELDRDNRIVNIKMSFNNVANSMVEEAMLCANLSGAQLLIEHGGQGIFNTHPGFDSDKVVKLSQLLANHGYIYHPQHLLTSGGFCQLQRELTSNNDNYFAARLRKFQQYANIDHQPKPHHGLGVEQYATWTSPIRKYGDLMNHRLIKAICCEGDAAPQPTQEDAALLKQQRDNQRAVERDINNWLYVEYLRHAAEHKQKFKAQIFNVNRGGVLAKLLKVGATVFIPFNQIHENRKSLKADTETGTVMVDGEIRVKITDVVTLSLTDVNLQKLTLTGSLLSSNTDKS